MCAFLIELNHLLFVFILYQSNWNFNWRPMMCTLIDYLNRLSFTCNNVFNVFFIDKWDTQNGEYKQTQIRMGVAIHAYKSDGLLSFKIEKSCDSDSLRFSFQLRFSFIQKWHSQSDLNFATFFFQLFQIFSIILFNRMCYRFVTIKTSIKKCIIKSSSI